MKPAIDALNARVLGIPLICVSHAMKLKAQNRLNKTLHQVHADRIREEAAYHLGEVEVVA